MAVATATCQCEKCGKTFEMTKDCFNRTQANEWEKYAESHYTTCTECYAKEKAENEKAKLAALNLPALVGSEKQIGWANDIRAKAIRIMNPQGDFAELISKITSAKWWIDNRNYRTVRDFAVAVKAEATK